MGKTSLIHYALSKLPRDNYASAYVDLWATDGEISFVTATAKAITESMGRSAEQLLDTPLDTTQGGAVHSCTYSLFRTLARPPVCPYGTLSNTPPLLIISLLSERCP